MRSAFTVLMFTCLCFCSGVFADTTLTHIGYFDICDISADGSTVVGNSFANAGIAYRWTAAAGIQQIIHTSGLRTSIGGVSGDGTKIVGTVNYVPFLWSGGSFQTVDFSNGTGMSWASGGDLSEDGRIICGQATVASYRGPFKWTQQTGGVQLGSIPGGTQGNAYLISGDGSTACGHDAFSGRFYGVVWKDGVEPVNIGGLQNTKYVFPRGISYNGDIVVGMTYNEFPDGTFNSQAFKWVNGQGMTGLDFLGSGRHAEATCVSGDGTIVGGNAYNGINADKAVIWDESGMKDFAEWLVNEHSVDLSDWMRLVSVDAISKDGRTFAGTGIYNGQDACWVVSIPEPVTSVLLVFGGIIATVTTRKNK